MIDSSSFVRGRFGIGVEAIGDIDQDGFEDVAISAPYHEDGRVYVYRGSATGLVTDLYQVHAHILEWRGWASYFCTVRLMYVHMCKI